MDDGGSLPVWVAAGVELAHPTKMDRRTRKVMASFAVDGCILIQETTPKYSAPPITGAGLAVVSGGD